MLSLVAARRERDPDRVRHGPPGEKLFFRGGQGGCRRGDELIFADLGRSIRGASSLRRVESGRRAFVLL